MKKPNVLTRCVANYYAAPNERIVEVSCDTGGCLIRLTKKYGRTEIHLYNLDKTTRVIVEGRTSGE